MARFEEGIIFQEWINDSVDLIFKNILWHVLDNMILGNILWITHLTIFLCYSFVMILIMVCIVINQKSWGQNNFFKLLISILFSTKLLLSNCNNGCTPAIVPNFFSKCISKMRINNTLVWSVFEPPMILTGTQIGRRPALQVATRCIRIAHLRLSSFSNSFN